MLRSGSFTNNQDNDPLSIVQHNITPLIALCYTSWWLCRATEYLEHILMSTILLTDRLIETVSCEGNFKVQDRIISPPWGSVWWAQIKVAVRKAVISWVLTSQILQESWRMLVGSLALFARCRNSFFAFLPTGDPPATMTQICLLICQLELLTLDREIWHHWWSHFSHFLRFAEQFYLNWQFIYPPTKN